MKKRSAFTLIELLAVVAIIVLLSAILLAAVSAVRKSQTCKTAAAEIEALKLALEKYREDFGDYPPSTLAELGINTADTTNEGNKALLVSLATTEKRGPYLPTHMLEDSARTRQTRDTVPDADDWAFGDDVIRDLLDLWGTPYFYFHNRDYSEETSQLTDVQTAHEPPVAANKWQVSAVCETDGVYFSPYSFQLWSAGPDETNNYGDADSDDLTSWR